ncbi:MAG: DUF6512 family protein [Clostridium sp.]|nr:DUF6512 family protein [Clostridium sp.]
MGTLAHFVYEWSGYNRIIGSVVPINESPWEHLKLIFFPYLIWSIVEIIALRAEKGMIFSKAIGVTAGICSTIIFFYTYIGILGRSIGWVNILSFFVGVAISFAIDNTLIKSDKIKNSIYDKIGIMIFIFLTIIFILCTFAPPLIPLFKDPITATYGI